MPAVVSEEELRELEARRQAKRGGPYNDAATPVEDASLLRTINLLRADVAKQGELLREAMQRIGMLGQQITPEALDREFGRRL